MIKFHCKNCGQKFNVPEINAGKKGKCPKCKSIVLIPYIEPIGLSPIEEQNGRFKVSPKTSSLDPTLLDLPQAKVQSPPTGYDIRSETAEDKLERQLQKKIEQSESVGNRKLPWIIDIFLYPVSVSGIIHLVIFFFSALLLPPALRPGYWSSPPIGHLALLVILTGYFLYYLVACIRDSAAGEPQAPDINLQPRKLDTDAILSRIFSTFVWVVVCVGPLLAYYIATQRVNLIFWLLVTYSIVFSPMSLLSIVLFDSLRALNPILIVASIFRVLVPYIRLVLAFCLICGFIVLVWTWSYLFGAGCVYLIMVMAHLLGRFYWRYKDKLNWEV